MKFLQAAISLFAVVAFAGSISSCATSTLALAGTGGWGWDQWDGWDNMAATGWY